MIYRDFEHYWREGNHGFTSSNKDLAKKIWDDFEETIKASHDDYKRAYNELCNEQTKVKSDLQDALLAYIKIFVPDTAPKFWGWWLGRETTTEEKNPHLVVIMGLPASGKTTYKKEHYPDYKSISWDEIIEETYPGKTYNESFKNSNYKEVEKIYNEKLENALQSNENIVIDMTLLDKKSRLKRITGVPDHYKKTIIVCQTSEAKFHERNKKRSLSGKTIPIDVFKKMQKRFEMPKEDEGFDEIIRSLT